MKSWTTLFIMGMSITGFYSHVNAQGNPNPSPPSFHIPHSLHHAAHSRSPEDALSSWAHRFGNSESTQVNGVAVDGDGNVYTVGTFLGTVDFDPGPGVANLTSAGDIDVFVCKLDADGNYVWAKRLGGTDEDWGNAIALDGPGSVFVVGYFYGVADFDPNAGTSELMAIGDADAFICKLDPNGLYVWAEKVGGNDDDEATTVMVNSNDDVIIGGFFYGTADFDPGVGEATLNSAGQGDAFLTMLDAGGIFVWARRFGGNAEDAIRDLARDADDHVIATGRFSGTVDFDPGGGTTILTSSGMSDVFVSKLDVLGNFVWAAKFGAADTDEGLGIDVDTAGNILTTGFFHGTVDFDPGPGTDNLTSAGEEDIFISKLTTAGEEVWAKRFGSTGTDKAHDVASDVAGNVYTTGYFTGTVDFDPNAGEMNLTSAGQWNTFISKLSPSGDFVSADLLSGDNNVKALTMAVDNNNYIYCGGNFDSTGDFDPGAGELILTASGSPDAFMVKLYQCSATYAVVGALGCGGYISPSGKYTWTESGAYMDTILNANGCDSVLTINLTIHQNTDSELTATVCNSFVAPSGDTLTQSGVYTDVILNAEGCDSIIVIFLTVAQSTSADISVTACDGYTSPDGKETWTGSGVYMDTIMNEAGCDSFIVINLTIETIDTAVLVVQNQMLSAVMANATYQWIDCENGNLPIPGATEQSYSPVASGHYAVIIATNYCTDTSSCNAIDIVGTRDMEPSDGLRLYPNPASDFIVLEWKPEFEVSQINLYDVQGRCVLKKQAEGENKVKLELNLSAGVYMVALAGKEGVGYRKLVVE